MVTAVRKSGVKKSRRTAVEVASVEPEPAAQTTLKDIDLATLMRMLSSASPAYIAGFKKELEARASTRPHSLLDAHVAGRLKAPSAAANPEPEAPVETEVERIAQRLMCDDGPENLAASRERFGAQLQGRDYVMIEVSTTSTSNRSEGLGEQSEPLYQRTLIAPRGTAERAVVEVARVCDKFDPGGREPEAWGEPTPTPAPQSVAEETPAGEPDSTGAADDLGDVLYENGLAALDLFRNRMRHSHYGERDAVVLKVATFAGEFRPGEASDDVLAMFALSSRPGAIEYAVRRVFDLARELDPEARSMSDLVSGADVVALVGQAPQERSEVAGRD